MRMFLVAAGLPLFLLTACGGGNEDFAVDIAAAPAKVFAPLTQIDLEMARRTFQGIDIRQSRPGEGEILYTIPSLSMTGEHREDSIIRLRLEPVEDGKSTRIHVSVDVPRVKVMMGEPNKVLSEAKVEDKLRDLLEALGRKIANGTDADTSRELSELLTAVAVVSNDQLQAQANEMSRDPQGYSERIALAEGINDKPAAASDPNDDWGKDADALPDETEPDNALPDDWGSK